MREPWSLDAYKAFNAALRAKLERDEKKMGKEKPSIETFVRRGRAAQSAVDDLVGHHAPKMLDHRQMREYGPSDAQLAKLLTHRLFKLRAQVRVLVAAPRDEMVVRTSAMAEELEQIAAEIEERLGR